MNCEESNKKTIINLENNIHLTEYKKNQIFIFEYKKHLENNVSKTRFYFENDIIVGFKTIEEFEGRKQQIKTTRIEDNKIITIDSLISTKRIDVENNTNKLNIDSLLKNDRIFSRIGFSIVSMNLLNKANFSISINEGEKISTSFLLKKNKLIKIEDYSYCNDSQIKFRLYDENKVLIHTGLLMNKRILKTNLLGDYLLSKNIFIEFDNLSNSLKTISVTYL